MSGSDDSSGMSSLDLLGASRGARFIVRLMLREKKATYSEMSEQLDLTPKELDEGIDEMISRGWLYVQEVDGENVYSLEIKKKEGSEVTRKGKGSAASAKITELWDKVDDGTTGTEEGQDAQRKMTSFHKEKRAGLAGLSALDDMAADAGGEPSVPPDIKAVEAVEDASGDIVKPLTLASPTSYPVTQDESVEVHPEERPDELTEQAGEETGGLLGLIRRWFRK
jgi:hypothetical protein